MARITLPNNARIFSGVLYKNEMNLNGDVQSVVFHPHSSLVRKPAMRSKTKSLSIHQPVFWSTHPQTCGQDLSTDFQLQREIRNWGMIFGSPDVTCSAWKQDEVVRTDKWLIVTCVGLVTQHMQENPLQKFWCLRTFSPLQVQTCQSQRNLSPEAHVPQMRTLCKFCSGALQIWLRRCSSGGWGRLTEPIRAAALLCTSAAPQ